MIGIVHIIKNHIILFFYDMLLIKEAYYEMIIAAKINISCSLDCLFLIYFITSVINYQSLCTDQICICDGAGCLCCHKMLR